MSLTLTVLASGSQGNASLVQAGDFGVLIDCGVGPRTLAARFKQAGLSWEQVNALVLTHTHGDHWKERTLVRFVQAGIPFYCHPGHHAPLADSEAFAQLQTAGLIRSFHARKWFELSPGLRCQALPIRHDSGATFGFRFERETENSGPGCSLAYLADLGTWDSALADALADVDLLALEFNHDVHMERTSGRGAYLIQRVLSDRGHLSNVQAKAFLKAILKRSTPGRLQRVVQLHLSDECNCPKLAAQVAREGLNEMASEAEVYTAFQHEPSPTFHLTASGPNPFMRSHSRKRSSRKHAVSQAQPSLPGFDY
jgi:phosphoribosyl 1,2-cyclic phosphodiesterase